MKQIFIFYIFSILSLTAMAMSNRETTESLLRYSSNQFTARMFTEVIKTKPQKSVVLSAISVMSPLAQLALASVGASHDELLAAIGTPGDHITKTVFSYANKELKAAADVTVTTASKIYVTKNSELNSNFVAITRDVFDSEIQNIDFEDSKKAVAEINIWVEGKTNNRIKNLLGPNAIGETTKAILVNAIYFKGTWVHPFHRALSRNFHVSKNNVIQVPIMTNTAHYNFTESEELNSYIIEIPYVGYEASLVVVLPREVNGIGELLNKLKEPNLVDDALKHKYDVTVDLRLPKFKIKTTTNLKEVLTNIGVTKLFDPMEAKLNNLLKHDDNVSIDSAVQKAYIDVHENGTEAAAANVLYLATSSRYPQRYFNANRPFYYAIKMNSLTLFSGVMYGY